MEGYKSSIACSALLTSYNFQSKHLFISYVIFCNGNWTEWSTIQEVIVTARYAKNQTALCNR